MKPDSIERAVNSGLKFKWKIGIKFSRINKAFKTIKKYFNGKI